MERQESALEQLLRLVTDLPPEGVTGLLLFAQGMQAAQAIHN